ncbi:YfhO family protein [Candidatus Woesearchaeota archaeon]|nr:YfhO family protein [Candidatus Woesearchaeota archaeon]
MQKMNKKTIIGFAVFVVLIILFFNKIILSPDDAATINADLLRMTSLWEGQINENLEKNNGLILWNSDVYSGTPFIGSPLTTMFYPISIIFYFVPFHKAIAYVMALNLFLIVVFFYLYLRLIRISRFSAMFSVAIFVFSGMVVLWAGIMSFINALMWFPLLLYFLERAIQEKRLVFGFLIGLVFGIQILGSGPQIFLYSAFVLFLYGALRLIYERKGLVRVSWIFAIAAVIGILIGSVQLLPMLEYTKYSIRGSGLGYETATMHSLPGYALITFLMPEFYGRGGLYWGFWKNSSFAEQYIYVGLTTLVLLLIAIFFVRKNKYAAIFAIIALFSLLFSLGKYTPFYRIFYSLPLFDSFRAPVRMMIFFVFSSAVISGFSLDALKEFDEEKKERLRKLLYVIGLLAAIVAIVAIISYTNREALIEFGKDMALKLYSENADASRITRSGLSRDYFLSLVPIILKNIFNSISIFLITIALILLVFYLWVQNKIRLKHLSWLLLIILIAELFMFSTKFIEPAGFGNRFETNPIIENIKKDEGLFRVLSLRSYQTKDNLPQYMAIKNDIQLASGCDAIFLRKYAEYSCFYGDCEVKADACIPINDVKYPRMIDLLNIKYVISPKDVNDGSLSFILNYNGANLYKNNDYLSRAYFVSKAIAVDKNEVLNAIVNKSFHPMNYIVTDENISDLNLFDRSEYRELEIESYSPNKVAIENEFGTNGFVVLSDVNYPGWNAYVDDEKAKIYDVNYILKAVYVNKGRHRIEFMYEPKYYKIGLYLSIFGLLLALFMAFLLR